MAKGIISNRGGVQVVAGGATVFQDEVLGQSGVTITFVQTYTFAAAGVLFYRNGVLMDKVGSFTLTGTDNAEEYQEVNLGAASVQITLNSTNPAAATELFQMVTLEGTASGGGTGIGDVDTLTIISDWDSTDGLTTETSGVNGETFRLTHDPSIVKFAEKSIPITNKFRDKLNVLEVDMNTTALSGNFKVIITDLTNAKPLADEVLTPQIDSKTRKARVVYSLLPLSGDLDITDIKIRFEALAEAGAPVSDFDDIVIKLEKHALTEVIAEIQEENTFSARIANNGTATIISESQNFIQSVNRTATGLIDIVFIPGTFAVAPSIHIQSTSFTDSGITVTNNLTASGVTIETYSSAGVLTDADTSVTVLRQGADHKDLSRVVEKEQSVFHEVLANMETSENAFAARIENNGTASITSESSSFIQSVSRISQGLVTVTWIPGFFSVPPAVSSTYEGAGATGDSSNNLAPTINSVQIWTGQSGVSNQDINFSIFVTRQGSDHIDNSLTRAVAAEDSKIEIPTSELRMEGASTRGTGAEAFTIIYDTVSSLRGDAFAINNANGTIITVLKDGLLDISSSIREDAATSFCWLTRNASDPSVSPLNGEILTGSLSTLTTVFGHNMSWSGTVSAGDIFRVSSESAINSASINTLTLIHQEQRIQVAISNIKPQYEDVDSMIRLHTGNGHGSTGVRIRRFSNLVDNLGSAIIYADSATEGASFTIQEDGVYHISHTDNCSISSTPGLSVNADGTISIEAIPEVNRLAISSGDSSNAVSDSESVSWSGILSKGDVIRPHGTGNIGGANRASFTISKQKESSIAAVDITPFARVNKGIKESYRADTRAGQGATNTAIPYYTNINENKTGSIVTVDNSSTLGWSLIANKKCYIVLTTAQTLAGASQIGISKNSNQLSTSFITITQAHKAQQATTSGANLTSNITFEGILEPGDTLRPHSEPGSTVFADRDSITFIAIADSLETVAEGPQAENIFAARIANNGTASVISESSPFVQSATRDSVGKVTLDISNLGLTVVPAINATITALASSSSAYNAKVIAISTTSVQIETTFSDPGVLTDFNFDISLTRQGSDYLDKSKILVQLATPKVAYVKDVKTASIDGGTFTSGAWRTRDLNTLEGDSSFISVSANQFTLDTGRYSIEAEAFGYRVALHKTKLRNITGSFDAIIGSSQSSFTASDIGDHSFIRGEVTLTGPEIFEIQHRCTVTRSTDGFGAASSLGIDEVYTQVKITKLA